MTNAPFPFDESLLSGYLDNELTPAEKQEVEAALSNSVPLQKLLAELRQIRSIVAESALETPRWEELKISPAKTAASAPTGSSELGQADRKRIVRDGPWLASAPSASEPVQLEQLRPLVRRTRRLWGAALLATAASLLLLCSLPWWQRSSSELSLRSPESSDVSGAKEVAQAKVDSSSDLPLAVESTESAVTALQTWQDDAPNGSYFGGSSLPPAPSASAFAIPEARGEVFLDEDGFRGLSMSRPVLEESPQEKSAALALPEGENPSQALPSSLGIQLVDAGFPADLVTDWRISTVASTEAPIGAAAARKIDRSNREQDRTASVQLLYLPMESNALDLNTLDSNTLELSASGDKAQSVFHLPPAVEETELHGLLPESIWRMLVQKWSPELQGSAESAEGLDAVEKIPVQEAALAQEDWAVITVDLARLTSTLSWDKLPVVRGEVASEELAKGEVVPPRESLTEEPMRQITIRLRNFPAKSGSSE